MLAGFISFFTAGEARAQRLNLERGTAALARETCVTVGAVMLCRYDFKFENKTVEAVVARLDRLKIPLLVIHGEKDEKTPVSQAFLLRDRLAELKKDFELKLFPEAGHTLEEQEVVPLVAEFFRRKMKGN